MAVIDPPSARVETAANVPINGGKLRVYDINTTTLSSVYSDEAMLTPLTNPVVADSNGFLPMIFAAAGTFDIAYLDASSGALTGQAYNDWPTVGGSTANTISATLSGARVKIDGGDIGDGTTGVRFQAGNPSPDETGGYLRLAGWGATQADKIIVDGAVVDVTQTKSLKEGGKRIASVLYTDATAFSAVTTLAIALPNTPTGTIAWKIRVYGFYVASASAVDMRLSYDSGATYKSGASDYTWTFLKNLVGTYTPGADDADTKIRALDATNGSSSTNIGVLEIDVVTVNGATGNTIVYGRLMGQNVGGGANLFCVMFEGAGLGGYGRATHLQLITGANMTGSYNVEALRGFGE